MISVSGGLRWARNVFRAGVLSALLAVSACASKATVQQVTADPGSYRGKTVVVTGTVDQPVAVAGYGLYRISNGDAHLWVQTTRGVPQAGSTARVTGQIYDGYDLRSLPLPLPGALRQGVILVESSRTASP
jgi:hypothetical protein